MMSYAERARDCRCPIAQQLLQLMAAKQTNLCVSADVTTAAELLTLADRLGPAICLLKTHIDIISDFTPGLTKQLRALADQHQFLIFEDRKFADIGHTVREQYAGGIYRIADWADLVNAHVLPGPGIIEGLYAADAGRQRGLILLAEMSSAGHLMDETYQQQAVTMAAAWPEYVMGFITQHRLAENPHWLNLTPGVQLASGRDTLGQQYVTPQTAIIDHGSDIIIVGRGILRADQPQLAAQHYRQQGWESYLQTLG